MNIINAVCWWTGAAVLCTATVYGLISITWLASGVIMKELGLWPDFCRALRVMYRERQKDQPAG